MSECNKECEQQRFEILFFVTLAPHCDVGIALVRIYYRDHKSPWLDPTLSQLNPVQFLQVPLT
jgi:hypothetical protein